MALAGLSLGLSGGDQPNKELVSPGVKALVVATSHLYPRSEITGVAHHTGLLEAPGKPVHLLNTPTGARPTPAPHWALSRGRALGSDSQRKQPSTQLPDPGSSLVEADIPEPSPSTSAAAPQVHFHSPLLPPAAGHPWSCLHPTLVATCRVQLPNVTRALVPSVQLLPSALLHSLPAHVRGLVARRPSEPA